MAIFTEETQKKILAAMQETTALTKIIANGWNVDSWKAVQTIVQAGAGEKYFPVGTQLQVSSQSYGTLLFDVVAHNHHKNPNDASAPTMTLLQHDVIYGQPFDSSELTWVNTTGSELAAGTYHFTGDHCNHPLSTLEDGTYQFTAPVGIPAGGAWRHDQIGCWRSAYSQKALLQGTITIYDADGNTLASGITCTVGSEGVDLGTCSASATYIVNTVGAFNSTQRSANGSNNWAESGIRQRLNATGAKGTWWKKQTIFDMPWAYASSQNGFLYGIDPEFLAVLGEVDNVTKRNTMFEADGVTSGSYTTRDKVFLLSRDELGYGSESGIAEGTVLDYYKNATSTDRIKYDRSSLTTARDWWLRSPAPWFAVVARRVYTTGNLGDNNVDYGFGAAAACVIY